MVVGWFFRHRFKVSGSLGCESASLVNDRCFGGFGVLSHLAVILMVSVWLKNPCLFLTYADAGVYQSVFFQWSVVGPFCVPDGLPLWRLGLHRAGSLDDNVGVAVD